MQVHNITMLAISDLNCNIPWHRWTIMKGIKRIRINWKNHAYLNHHGCQAVYQFTGVVSLLSGLENHEIDLVNPLKSHNACRGDTCPIRQCDCQLNIFISTGAFLYNWFVDAFIRVTWFYSDVRSGQTDHWNKVTCPQATGKPRIETVNFSESSIQSSFPVFF